MEIKMKILLIICLINFSSYSFTDDDLLMYIPKKTDISFQAEKPIPPDPVIFYNSTVIKNSDLNDNFSDYKQLGDYSYEVEKGKLSLIANNFPINKNKLKLVESVDGQYKISDGSVMIEFNEIPNFLNFSSEYNLIFLYDFSTIKRASFRTNNFLELENLITLLRSDQRVKTVSLSTINPSIKPQ